MARRREISDDKIFSLAVVAVLVLAVSALTSAGVGTGYITGAATTTATTEVGASIEFAPGLTINDTTCRTSSTTLARGATDYCSIQLENTGTNVATITYYSDTSDTSFWSGTGGEFSTAIYNNLSGTANVSLYQTYVRLDTGTNQLITGLSQIDSVDTVDVSFKLTAPSDETTGTKTATITFTISE